MTQLCSSFQVLKNLKKQKPLFRHTLYRLSTGSPFSSWLFRYSGSFVVFHMNFKLFALFLGKMPLERKAIKSELFIFIYCFNLSAYIYLKHMVLIEL